MGLRGLGFKIEAYDTESNQLLKKIFLSNVGLKTKLRKKGVISPLEKGGLSTLPKNTNS